MDFVFCNESWLRVFDKSAAHLLAPGVSDHSQIVIQLDQEIVSGPKPFKYKVFWQDHPDYLDVFKSAWVSSHRGQFWISFSLWLVLKKNLTILNRTDFSNLVARVKEKNLRFDLARLSKAEAALMRDKDRVTWIEKGDASISFFYRSVLAYKNQQKISMVMDEEGKSVTDPKGIEELVVKFYKELFTSKRTLIVSQMAEGKSSGPDGLSFEFYKYHWEYIQEDLFVVMRDIFPTGRVPAWMNLTTLSLIPKVDHPSSVRDYRPISCCNNFYKAVTRILMSRMKSLMPGLIFLSQSAFIPGRNLGDSVMMLQEMVQGYHVDDGVPKAAIKVDLQKAYDMVEWSSLWAVMEAMQFPVRFVSLLKTCVENAGFSVNINGTLKGWFTSSRGLGQGDPISSYLFILVLDVFNGLMRKAVEGPEFIFYPGCQRLGITHLSFADDMVILVSADPESFKIVKDTL
ncbi:hypothetical protein LIER_32484 [Lithospermum erythrorhizon]|uniref:Reverse transcriptase domain-containing protein n=1 Tax=Lithospermum erythrorhizon TaxID=34254 RepID=A0AAV3RTZ6_LITER